MSIDTIIKELDKNISHAIRNKWQSSYVTGMRDARELVSRHKSAKASQQPTRSVGLTEKGECQEEAKELGVQVPGAAPSHQSDDSPYKTVSGKPSYIRLTDDLDHAYGQWMNSHGTARAKRVEEEFLFWCSANLHEFRKLKLPKRETQ